MIFQPAIIALLTGSILTGLMLLYSLHYGVKILRSWNIRSGSELQLSLERRTYLISTVMAYAFGFQLVSLFLFIYTADHLHAFFIGAMCAAGALHVNAWGYPAVLLKTVNFLLAGLWLILNHADNLGYDYPLIRTKYLLLLAISPLLLGETAVQTAYFLGLKPHVITSCCGTLFSTELPGVTASVLSLPRLPVELAAVALLGLVFAAGVRFLRSGRGAVPLALLNLVALPVALAVLITVVGPYIYELPTHFCPFCILQKEYHYIGYPIYGALLIGVLSGTGVGLIQPFARVESLRAVLPGLQKRLARVCMVSHAVLAVISAGEIALSNLRM